MKRGITLVETLIAVAIAAVLAALLFPVGISLRRRAAHTNCAERLRQLGGAEHLYAIDHEGWVPPATTSESAYLARGDMDAGKVAQSPEVLVAALSPYLRDRDVWFCPSDVYARTRTLWLGQRHLQTSYFFNPLQDGQIGQWPPRMQLMRDRLVQTPPGKEDVPLICDSVGVPDVDSAPSLATHDGRSASNHPDNGVNAIRHDLSLWRTKASTMMGTQH